MVDAGLAVEKEERLGHLQASRSLALPRGMTVRRAAYLIGWTIPQRVAEAVVSGIEYVSWRRRRHLNPKSSPCLVVQDEPEVTAAWRALSDLFTFHMVPN